MSSDAWSTKTANLCPARRCEASGVPFAYATRLDSVGADADGRFRAVLIPGCRYSFKAQPQLREMAYLTIERDLAIEPGETKDLGTIDLASDKRPEPVRTKSRDARVGAESPNGAASPAAVAADDDRITIPGRVLDPAGKPVAGATVRLVRWYWDPGADRKPLAETRSDQAGHFEITYRKSKLDIDIRRQENWKFITVTAFKTGYGPAWVKWQEIPGAEQVELRWLRTGVPITGRLIDLEGRPLAGVNVECEMLTMPIGADLSPWIEAVKAGKSRQTADTHIVFPVPIGRGRPCARQSSPTPTAGFVWAASAASEWPGSFSAGRP